MRVACLIPWLVIGLLFPGQIPSLFGQGVATLIHDVSDMADGSVTQARLEAQRQAASGDLAYRSYTKGDPSSFSGKYTPPELPDDKKGRFVYGLALFSDDGCNVTVNGSLIHQRMGQGQHLPNIGDSFHVLPTALAPENPLTSPSTTRTSSTTMTPIVPATLTSTAAHCFFISFPWNRSRCQPGWNDCIFRRSQGHHIPGRPFRFWINDDNDFGDSDHADAVLKDSSFDINSLRDLEDYARLHIYLGGLQDAVAAGKIIVGLEWRHVEPVDGSSPSIKVFQAAEPDGGKDYIEDKDGSGNWPTSQSAGTFSTALGTVSSTGGVKFKFKKEFWDQSQYGLPKLSADHPNRYLLFDGVTEGKGQLVMTFYKEDGTTLIGEGGGCWLDIKNIKKMYYRGKAQPENIAAPNGNVVGPFIGPMLWVEDPNGRPFPTEKPKDENDKAIIFVHGWSMDYKNYISFSETMFKRLWQTGFKSRCTGTLRWDPLVIRLELSR